MSLSGMCSVCERRTAEHSCPNCGALVCEKHFDREFKMCLTCAPSGRTGQQRVTDDDIDTLQ